MPTANQIALSVSLKELIGNLYVMYLRAHGAHWNIEGPLFHSLHAYFDALNSDVFGSIDGFAEALRQHEFYAPYTLSHVLKLATIGDVVLPAGQPTPMLQDLAGVNGQIMLSLKRVYRDAEAVGDLGLSNYVQDRLGAHLKHDWQLRAQLRAFDTTAY